MRLQKQQLIKAQQAQIKTAGHSKVSTCLKLEEGENASGIGCNPTAQYPQTLPIKHPQEPGGERGEQVGPKEEEPCFGVRGEWGRTGKGEPHLRQEKEATGTGPQSHP